jgi:hypothetical protein
LCHKVHIYCCWFIDCYKYSISGLILLLENMGPEGLGRKNFKIETQCNYKSGPRECVPISVL